DGQDYVLMHFGKNPQSFQLVGGRREADETAVQALTREISEEMQEAKIELGRDYEVSEPLDISFCYQSTRTGAFTKFNISHFIATDMKAPPKLSANLRWIGLHEISKGRTTEGQRILPPPESVKPLSALLERAKPSFAADVDPGAHMPIPDQAQFISEPV